MKKPELNELLKRAAVPEREPDYWDSFPGRVMGEIERRRLANGAERVADASRDTEADSGNMWFQVTFLRSLVNKPAFALAVVAVCLALGFVVGHWSGQRSPGYDPQLAEARKYFREIEGLFPHQLQAIVFDQQGAHLVLAQEADLPASPPLYLKICGPGGCQRFVTFSGQQIRVNGEVCDVLSDHQGNVLLVGRRLLWSSSRAGSRTGPYQIQARALESRL
jgi:hypothetical protein